MSKDRKDLFTALIFPLVLTTIMWCVFLVELIGDYNWVLYGVSPHKLSGLRGILFSPFLHSGWEHLLSNTPTVLFLSTALFYFYKAPAMELMFWQFIMNGLFLWVLGVPGTYHIGASGLIYSLAFFLLLSGFLRKNKALTVISLVIIMLYGSLVWGLFPVQPGVSWEGHFAGFITGIILAIFFRKEGPGNDPGKVWDDSDLDDQDPYWNTDDKEITPEDQPLRIRYHYKG